MTRISIEVVPATAERWVDLEALVGPRRAAQALAPPRGMTNGT